MTTRQRDLLRLLAVLGIAVALLILLRPFLGFVATGAALLLRLWWALALLALALWLYLATTSRRGRP